ncbi:MAG: glycoside hydrolase family 16 protein [Ignavibacteria bacterium]|nr:glycoside hydrolase family 16 protein [Ignavibacteria bacterium]
MNKKFFIFAAIFIFSFSLLISSGFRNDEYVNYEWKLTFEDNFDIFDKTKWIHNFDAGNRTIWSNKELQWYKDENATVENGILKLTAKKESIYGKDTQGEKQFEYTSGLISSSPSFTQAYGKWEIRTKFPFRKGFWPAFWLVAKQQPGLPEIDVFEYFGINKNKISIAHHWGIDYPNYAGGMYEGKTEPFYYLRNKEFDGNFSNVWMVWSFECFPNKMVWKLNDNIVYETTEGIPTAPLYILANIAIKDWPDNNNEVDNTDSPYVMEIDYIRVYKMVPKQN